MAADQKRGKDLPERIQMRCPKCGEEFAFSRGNLEKERAELVLKCDEAKLHLREINKLPKSAHTDQTWRDKTYWSRIYEQVTQRLTEIKVQFRQVNQSINDSLFHLYRERMIDLFGRDTDDSVMKWAKENLEAYQISGLSAHEFYTHKGGKIVRKV